MINDKPNKDGGRPILYSNSFKVQLALEYLNGEYSCSQIARKYQIPAKAMEYFVSWYRKSHQSTMTEEPLEIEDPSLSSKDVKALERKLVLAEMKIAALEKVIAIANEEYRTDLKKKAATR